MEQQQSSLGAAVEEAKGQLSTAAQAVKEAVQEKARDFAEGQKAEGAKRVDRLGEAVQRAAGELKTELPELSRFIESAAENLRNAGISLREHNIGDLTERFHRFAMHQPAAAFAGSVLAGFALARFLKSAPQAQEPPK